MMGDRVGKLDQAQSKKFGFYSVESEDLAFVKKQGRGIIRTALKKIAPAPDYKMVCCRGEQAQSPMRDIETTAPAY